MLSRFHLIPERYGRTDGQICYRLSISRISILRCWRAIKIVRFRWNLVHYSKYWTWLQSRHQKLKFLKFKMAATAILKIAFLAITHRPIVRFWRNFVWGSKTACRQRLQIFKIQDGGRPPFWKSLYRHISVKKFPILMKFSTQHQILNPIMVS